MKSVKDFGETKSRVILSWDEIIRAINREVKDERTRCYERHQGQDV